MPLSLYDASVPVFLRYLERLGGMLDATEHFAKVHERSTAELLAARLAPDMLPLATQVVIAVNFTLRAAFPLVGEAVPPPRAFSGTIEGLRAQIAHASTLLRSLQPDRFLGAETRTLESQAGNAIVRLPAPEFLFQYALPNFFFHLTAVYAILRSQGMPLGKEDFDGFHAYPREH